MLPRRFHSVSIVRKLILEWQSLVKRSSIAFYSRMRAPTATRHQQFARPSFEIGDDGMTIVCRQCRTRPHETGQYLEVSRTGSQRAISLGNQEPWNRASR